MTDNVVHAVGQGALTAQAAVVEGTGAISLKTTADNYLPSETPDSKRKGMQRWVMLTVIIVLFAGLNALVAYFISQALDFDIAFVTAHPELADKRIISSGVVQALIGATVVQTGAIAWAMARYLFPSQSE